MMLPVGYMGVYVNAGMCKFVFKVKKIFFIIIILFGQGMWLGSQGAEKSRTRTHGPPPAKPIEDGEN